VAASTSGALKQFLDGQSLGISVYRDQAPDGTPKPYLTVSEAVAIVPDKLEDGAPSTVKEHVTVDVWMDWKNIGSTVLNGVNPGGILESYALPGAIAKALQGSRLLPSGTGAPPTTVYAAIVRSIGPRLVERDENLVHIPIWVELWRNA
jgi:hypothetical protein